MIVIRTIDVILYLPKLYTKRDTCTSLINPRINGSLYYFLESNPIENIILPFFLNVQEVIFGIKDQKRPYYPFYHRV